MMKPMRSLAILAAGVTMSGSTVVHAEPLELRRVASGASWIVHVDVERMRATEVGRALLSHLDNVGFDGVQNIHNQVGFDMREHVNGVTVYGGGALGEDPVIVASVADTVGDTLVKLREEQHAERRTRDGLTYDVIGADGGDGVFIFELREGGRNLLVISPSEEHMLAGVGVVQGRGERMQKLPFASPSARSFVFFTAGDVLKLGEENMASQFLRLTERIGLDVGGDKDLDARIVLETQDEASAQNLVQGVQGLLAFARMAAMNQKDLGAQERQALDLLNAIRMTSAARAVTIELSVPLDVLKALAQD